MEKRSTLIGWPKLYMKVIFAWPKRWYWPIFLLPTFTLICLSNATIYFSSEVRDDPGKLVQVFREMAGFLSVIVKPFGVYLLAERIQNVYNYVETEMATYDKFLSDKAKTAATRRFLIGNRICRGIASLYTFGFFTIAIPPWIVYYTEPIETRKLDMTVAPEDIFLRQNGGFTFMCTTLSLNAYTVFNGAATFDILFVVTCVLISTMSTNLSAMLKDVGERIRALHLRSPQPPDADEDSTKIVIEKDQREERVNPSDLKYSETWLGSECDEQTIFASVIRCVKYHQTISKLREDMNAICSVSLLINVTFIVIFLGLSLFQALYLGTRVPRTFIAAGLIVFWNFCLLGYIFASGEEVIKKSEDVAKAAYSVYVSGYCSPRLRNALLFIMMRSQRPFCLTAWKFFKINNATLMEVAQKTYSLVACAFKLMN